MTTDGDGDDIIVSMPVSMSVPMPVPMFMVKPMTMSFGQRCGYSFLTILLCRDSMAECKQQQKPKDRDRKRKFLLAKKRFSCRKIENRLMRSSIISHQNPVSTQIVFFSDIP
ncbi:hypothetical protein RUM43_008365 [Polyplax serrata]|uniref:Uncharacterized protein n=1 Tax=Polyplax serrata TaxID=468196 RepID=A0AAN8PNC7_POLSC